MALAYRSVWISDIHLGTRGCKAEYLLDFLNHVECDRLYLVGDIIDLWKLKSGFYWPGMHNQIVRRIIEAARNGTQVTYIPGNHDDVFRHYANMEICSIRIKRNAVHECADGRRFLVLHGDEFDGVVCNSKWLAFLGSEAYELLLVINRMFNGLRRRLGFTYWSLSAYVKHKVKNAVNFISNFEQILSHEAAKRGVDGVICGHIHHAAITRMDNRLIYCNCGDWVESCTALVESKNGDLSLIRWVEDSVHLLAGKDDQTVENYPDKRRLAAAD